MSTFFNITLSCETKRNETQRRNHSYMSIVPLLYQEYLFDEPNILHFSKKQNQHFKSTQTSLFFLLKRRWRTRNLRFTLLCIYSDWLHFLHSHNYSCWNSCFLYVPNHPAFFQLYDRNVENARTSVVELHDKAEKQRDPLTQFLRFGISERMYCSMFLYEASIVGVHSKRRIQYYLCMGICYVVYRSVTFISFLNLLEY